MGAISDLINAGNKEGKAKSKATIEPDEDDEITTEEEEVEETEEEEEEGNQEKEEEEEEDKEGEDEEDEEEEDDDKPKAKSDKEFNFSRLKTKLKKEYERSTLALQKKVKDLTEELNGMTEAKALIEADRFTGSAAFTAEYETPIVEAEKSLKETVAGLEEVISDPKKKTAFADAVKRISVALRDVNAKTSIKIDDAMAALDGVIGPMAQASLGRKLDAYIQSVLARDAAASSSEGPATLEARRKEKFGKAASSIESLVMASRDKDMSNVMLSLLPDDDTESGRDAAIAMVKKRAKELSSEAVEFISTGNPTKGLREALAYAANAPLIERTVKRLVEINKSLSEKLKATKKGLPEVKKSGSLTKPSLKNTAKRGSISSLFS
jgi:hypothetical protein